MFVKEKSVNHHEADILATLINGEKYGLEIRDELFKRTSYDMPLGLLYPTMDILIDGGFVKAHTRGVSARRYYNLTAAGHRVLNATETPANVCLGGL